MELRGSVLQGPSTGTASETAKNRLPHWFKPQAGNWLPQLVRIVFGTGFKLKPVIYVPTFSTGLCQTSRKRAGVGSTFPRVRLNPLGREGVVL
jgi:hypothetical protein